MINTIEYLTDPFNYTEDAERQRRPTASTIVFLWTLKRIGFDKIVCSVRGRLCCHVLAGSVAMLGLGDTVSAP